MHFNLEKNQIAKILLLVIELCKQQELDGPKF